MPRACWVSQEAAMRDEAIFDLHQHFGALIGVPGAGRNGASSMEADCANRLAFMDSFGIAMAAIMPGHSYSAPSGLTDITAMNDALHAYGALAPDRFAALFGTVDPRHGRECLPEIARVYAMGFRGLSWHHRMQGLPIDHAVMFDVVERMDDLGMIGLFHCYANGDFESPWRLRRLAERFPRTTFFALDAMTSPENLEQLLGIAERCDNLFIDLTSTLLGGRGIRQAVERVGAGRLVFGSNFYSMSRVDRVDALEALDAAGLDERDRSAILSGNARRLLGIGL
jgi:predicted TIM-barrel fold metal-dependent hydrolase